MADRTFEIMRIADEIAALTADTDRQTARGILECIVSCAALRYDAQHPEILKDE